jgi:nucleoside-diphosphate-sugar epimerase
VKWKKGSVTDCQSLLNAIPSHADTVFHLAGDTNLWAHNNERQRTINVDGTANVVAAAAHNNIKTLVHTSSVAAWGNISGEVTERHEQHGENSWINYERTKWTGERKALEGLKHGMRVVILNPANVIGPHDKNNWGRLFLALRNDKLPCIADGCVSVAHVANVARAHLAAAEKGKSGNRYILAGEQHPFSDFVACINRVSRAGNMPKVIHPQLFRGYAKLSSAMAGFFDREPSLTPELAHLMSRKNVAYSSGKAKDQLGYSIPPMRRSVEDCYCWLKSENIL